MSRRKGIPDIPNPPPPPPKSSGPIGKRPFVIGESEASEFLKHLKVQDHVVIAYSVTRSESGQVSIECELWPPDGSVNTEAILNEERNRAGR